jgi:hypothetical protein
MNDTINYILAGSLFKPLERLCTSTGIEGCLKSFKNYHYEQREENNYISCEFDNETNTFKTYERVGLDDYKYISYSFHDYFTNQVRERVTSIKKYYYDVYSKQIIIDLDLDRNLRDLLNTKRDELIKLADKLLSYESYTAILRNEICTLVLLELPKYSKKKSRISDSVSHNFFYSEKFTPDVTETIYRTLQNNKLITNCTIYQFRGVFTNNKDNSSSSTKKINWNCQINIVRYFIEQLEVRFEIQVNSTKWSIADECFTIKSKDHNFSKQGTTGKEPKVKAKREMVDSILTKALKIYNG